MGEGRPPPHNEENQMQPGGMPSGDMSQLLAQAKQMQQQLAAAQEEIAKSEVVGDAGNGLVKVTMQGSGKVTAVEIDPKVVDAEDVETLQDLVVGAFGDAHDKVANLAETKLGPLAGGMGGGLGDMMGGLGM